MRRVCVFCGSSSGDRADYAAAATSLGAAIAERGLGLVYGGGNVGLMGLLADAALAGGAEVIGVIPEALRARELGHTEITELHVVDGMHARKAKMAELADAFVALPGGLGTLEETFEVWTWAQLGFHAKPVCLFDVAGYWRPLIELVDNLVREGFVRQRDHEMLIVANDVDALFGRIAAYRPPRVPKWIGAGET